MSWFTHTCRYCNEPIGKKDGAWLAPSGFQCATRVWRTGGMYGSHFPYFVAPKES